MFLKMKTHAVKRLLLRSMWIFETQTNNFWNNLYFRPKLTYQSSNALSTCCLVTDRCMCYLAIEICIVNNIMYYMQLHKWKSIGSCPLQQTCISKRMYVSNYYQRYWCTWEEKWTSTHWVQQKAFVALTGYHCASINKQPSYCMCRIISAVGRDCFL